MDGRRSRGITNEGPIAKPDFPLPLVFSPSKRSEWVTRRQAESQAASERAHFYRKQVDENGRPTYGFFITHETADRDTVN